MTSLLDQQAGLEPFARQGAYNDPDMLEVGNGGMTSTEYTAHFSLWALLSSPLLLGNDLRSISSGTLSIIRNADVVAVNQDWGGSQGRRVRDFGATEVWAKPMSDGSAAVVLFNRNTSAATVATSAAELGLGGSSSYTLRNLWTGAVSSTSGTISASVPGHGVVMYRVSRGGTLAAGPGAGTLQVGTMPWLASVNGWGPAERNESNGEQAAGDGGTLTVNGTTYAAGVGVHADSAIQLYLGRACPLFSASVGVDDEVSNAAASVRFQVYGDGRLLAYTAVKTASQGPTPLSVATGGYSTLELRVTDGRSGGISYDHADWGNATVTCTGAGTGSYASDRSWSSAANGWGPAERDQSNAEQAAGDGVVLTVGGVSYVKGIGAHAAGDIAIALGGSCERFTAVAGVDGETTSAAASVVFSVTADGATLFTSPTVRAGGVVTVNVDVTGRSTLHLVVGNAGDGINSDHADWADARLMC
jgi:alpha-galactosidase